MKKIIHETTCDICGRIIKPNEYYDYIHIPAPIYDLSAYFYFKTGKLTSIQKKEVCGDCLKKISDAIEVLCSKFGFYTYQGDCIRWKAENEGEVQLEDKE